MSVRPLLMTDGQLIELLPAHAPLLHDSIHQRDEAGVVCRLQEVNHLVDDDVFEALGWLFCEIGVEADAVCIGVAAPPFRLHPLHKDALHLHTHYRLPLRQQIRECG